LLRVASAGSVVLLDVQTIQQAIEVLHIADIAPEAHHRALVEGFEAVDVGEAGEGAVGGEVVGGDDDAGGEFEGEDGGAGYDGGLGAGGGLVGAAEGGGEVGRVVGAVDFVAGLEGVLVEGACG